MKLEAWIDGARREVELTREPAGPARLRIDGEERPIDARMLQPGLYSVLVGRRSLEVSLEPEPGGGYSMLVDGVRHTVRLVDPRRFSGPGAAAQATGRQEARAPMPGKIVRVLAEVGQSVRTGEGLLVVEAMKMQNEMKAAIDGHVTAIHVAVGDLVSAGQVLAVLE
jgi:acetyl/propionyl-CoA carboxylase alpha subunit